MNNVVLVGRLARDPETRYSADTQTAVTRFTVAVDRPFSKDDQTADFLRVVAFGKQAEFVEKYFSKGKLIGIQGRIQTGSYTNKDGATVYTTDIVAERIEFVGSKAESGGGSAGAQNSFAAPATSSAQQPSGAAAGIPEGFQALEDDDMPF